MRVQGLEKAIDQPSFDDWKPLGSDLLLQRVFFRRLTWRRGFDPIKKGDLISWPPTARREPGDAFDAAAL